MECGPVIELVVIILRDAPISSSAAQRPGGQPRLGVGKEDHHMSWWKSPADSPLDISRDESHRPQVPRCDAVRQISPKNRHPSHITRKTADKPK